MAAVLYTTTEAIRAAVGVTTKELTEALFTDQRLELQVKVALYNKIPTYEAVRTAGTTLGAPADAVQASNLLELFCLYFGAVRSIEMILAMRQSVTDGKQQVDRFSIDWKALLEAMRKRLDDVVDQLEDLLGTNPSGIPYFGRAVPSYDPVTNT